jgi:hypothetical protein
MDPVYAGGAPSGVGTSVGDVSDVGVCGSFSADELPAEVESGGTGSSSWGKGCVTLEGDYLCDSETDLDHDCRVRSLRIHPKAG